MGDSTRVRFPSLEAFLIQNQGALATAGRPLTTTERRILEEVFGMSINLDRIRLTETNVAVNGRAYTLGNTIRFPTRATVDLRTLVHEATHVWQYQTKGAGYISDSVWHQAAGGQAAYDVTIVTGQSIHRYHAEQQAMIVERYYTNDPAGWATNADVVRMMAEVRRARPISDLDIQQDILYGPGRGAANPFMTLPTDDRRDPQVMPLIRIEFPGL
jgi:hypothetical protein